MLKINNNISFGHKYFLQGNKQEVDSAYKDIKKQNKKNKIDTDYIDFKTADNAPMRFVFTDDDASKKYMKTFTPEILHTLKPAAMFIVNTKKLLDKVNLLSFDAAKGVIETKSRFTYEDMTLKFRANNINGGVKSLHKIDSVDFNKPLSLKHAVWRTYILNGETVKTNDGNLKMPFNFNYTDMMFEEMAATIDNDPKLSQIETTKLLAQGGTCHAFETRDDKVIKISLKPIFPQKTELFEAEIIDKGISKTPSGRRLYWYTQEKGLNSFETQITEEEAIEFSRQVEAQGFEIEDWHVGQLAKFGDRLKLIDYECIKNRKLVGNLMD